MRCKVMSKIIFSITAFFTLTNLCSYMYCVNMKRSNISSVGGIAKFLIRQGPSEPEPVPVSGQESENSAKSSKSLSNGKHRMSGFNIEWKKEFPWVEEADNGMKCQLCIRHQRRPKKVRIGKAAWVDVPCTWLTKDAVSRHSKSDAHLEAMAFEASRTRPAQTLEASAETVGSLNKQARVSAFRCLYWLVKNELPHTTNYKSLLELCKEQGVSVINNLHQGENDKAESQRFIQEAVLTMGKVVQQPLLTLIRASPWYSLLMDETTDVAVVKELILYARYLKDGKSCTDFLTILPLPSGTAECIVATVQTFLREINLPLEKMCAVGSDGASVMVGKHNGVAARLRSQVPHLLSNHCVAHRLALAVAQASKSIPYLTKFKDIMGQLHRFYANSAVRMEGLRQIQELQNDPVLKLSQAKDVRWLSHDKATQTLKRCLPSVFTSLEREAEERNDSQAMGLSVFVQSYKFIFSLSMMCDILPHMSALSRAMQTRDAIFTTVKPLVSGTISLLKQMRNQPGNNMENALGLTTSLSEQNFNIRLPTDKQVQDFMDQVYRPFIDGLVENLENRFPDIPVIEKFQTFAARDIPEECSMYGKDDIQDLAMHFGLDCTKTLVEWSQVKAALATPEKCAMDAAQTLEWIAGNLRESHPNLHSLATVGLLLPTSTADCERGFSALNRIKTTHRASLTNRVLNALIIISVQGPVISDFDFSTAVGEWYKEKPRRTVL